MSKRKSTANFLKKEDQELASELLKSHKVIYVAQTGDIFTNESFAKLAGVPYETLVEEAFEEIEANPLEPSNKES